MDNEVIYKYVPLWGSWQIEEHLGKGAFGSVYRISKDVYDNKIYSVVKIISIPNNDQYNSAVSITGSRDDATLSKYFESLAKSLVNEINLLYTLKGSSNIISFEDHMIEKKSNEVGWDILIRMEQATSLTEYLKNNTIDEEGVIKLGIDICTGLDLCYEKGILHRDIKEDNLFISKNNTYKIGDFGVSKALYDSTKAATRVGSMLYIAPEVFSGSLYDISADLYSLGIVMFKLLNNGRIPFLGLGKNVSTSEVESAIAKRLSSNEFPKPKYCSSAMGEIIQKACSFNPEKRFRTPKELIKALRSINNNTNNSIPYNPDDGTDIGNALTQPAYINNSQNNPSFQGNKSQNTSIQENNLQNNSQINNNSDNPKNKNIIKIVSLVSIGIFLFITLLVGSFLFIFNKINNNKETTANNNTQVTSQVTSQETSQETKEPKETMSNNNSTKAEEEIENAIYIDDQDNPKCYLKLGISRTEIEKMLKSKDINFKYDNSEKILTCSQYNVESMLMEFDNSNNLSQILIVSPNVRSLMDVAVEEDYSYEKFGIDYETKMKSKTKEEEDIFEYIYIYDKGSYSVFYTTTVLDEIIGWGVINKSAKNITKKPSLVSKIKSKY